jgi:hypothetical protein
MRRFGLGLGQLAIAAAMLFFCTGGCPLLGRKWADRRETGRANQVRQLHLPALGSAVAAYQQRTGHAPERLSALGDAGLLGTGAKDPWGSAYLYERRDGLLRIVSLGKDGEPDGAGHDADIECWMGDTSALGPGLRSCLTCE